MKAMIATGMIIFLVFFIGCSKEEKTYKDIDNNDNALKISAEDQALLEKAADKKIGMFMTALKGELMAAMKDGGPVNAISVCNESAPEIAMAHSEMGWTISRVSDRARNQNNLADSAQLEILHKFTDTAIHSTEEWADSTYYYYKPIRVAGMCLGCHGPADKLAPGVSEKVAELYPEDKAVGYAPGDLRGMFVVEAEWPGALDYAKEILNDSL